jgi:hypothetical protein
LWLNFFHFPCNFAVFPGKKISMRLSWPGTVLFPWGFIPRRFALNLTHNSGYNYISPRIINREGEKEKKRMGVLQRKPHTFWLIC